MFNLLNFIGDKVHYPSQTNKDALWYQYSLLITLQTSEQGPTNTKNVGQDLANVFCIYR